MNNHVVIAGGGFMGCIAAMLFAKLNIDVTIVEAKPFDDNKKSDPRGIALNYASCELLKTLNLWPDLLKHTSPIKTVHVSAKKAFSKVRFYAKDQGLDYLAYVVEGTHLLKTLIEHSKSFKNIHWQQPDSIKSIENRENHLALTLTSDDTLSATLLIAADGQRSKTRELLNIQTTGQTTQHALLSNITTSPPPGHTAFERFTEQGTIALLPLNTTQYKCVISHDEKTINHWLNLKDDEFIKTLQQHFGFFAGQFTSATSRLHYPLAELTATKQTAQRAILLGNAAHALHPIAAQGLNLAVQETVALYDLVKSAIAYQQDIGETELLEQYEQAVKTRQQRVGQLTGMLSKLHGGIINRSALALVANCPMLQTIIRKQAVGV